jgi:Flp pilus assembly protein TadG
MKRDMAAKKSNGEQGQSLVEFALTLPLLLLLLLGMIDLGMGYRTYIVLTNAAREGARSITIYPSNSSLATERIRAEAGTIGLADALESEDGDISFSPAGPYNAGDKVTVTVAYDYPVLFGAVPGIDVIEFSASSTMVVLYDN